MVRHFFIIGGQRCGTTYLYSHLDAHPEIEMARPLRPEPKFFFDDALFNQGLIEYEHRFFTTPPSCDVRGEKSTVYYESESAAQRISQSFENPAVILILRDPIERAISNYQFSVQNGFETLSIEDAFRNEQARLNDYEKDKVSVSPFAYLARGNYIHYINMYDHYFPRDRFKIILFEELIRNPEIIREIFCFLGVNPDSKGSGFEKTINASDPTNRMAISTDLRKWLIDQFQESHDKLSRRLGRSLSIWPNFEDQTLK